jgi:hypothetical protein
MPGEASYHFDNVLEDDEYAEDDQRSLLGPMGAVLPR